MAEKLDDIYVIDADVHVHENPGEFAEYADSPWDVALREIARLGNTQLTSAGAVLPGLAPWANFQIPFPGGSNRPQIVTNVQDMRHELDDLRINEAVIFPDFLLLLAVVTDPSFASSAARAYNKWLCERWLEEEPTLRGALVIPPQDPTIGAEEIRKYGDRREFVCAYLPASGLKTLYGHEWYDPVYRAAGDLGMPVVIHSVETVHPVFPFQLDGFRTALARHALAHPFSMIANLVSMLETGVPVRFPELKIAFMEAGTAWVPWITNRLDKEYIERRRELPHLKERPSHYIREFYFGTQPIEEPEHRQDVVRLFELFDGENRALFASDWPHHDFDHPQHILTLPFSAEAKRRILGQNAVEFFGMDGGRVSERR